MQFRVKWAKYNSQTQNSIVGYGKPTSFKIATAWVEKMNEQYLDIVHEVELIWQEEDAGYYFKAGHLAEKAFAP